MSSLPPSDSHGCRVLCVEQQILESKLKCQVFSVQLGSLFPVLELLKPRLEDCVKG